MAQFQPPQVRSQETDGRPLIFARRPAVGEKAHTESAYNLATIQWHATTSRNRPKSGLPAGGGSLLNPDCEPPPPAPGGGTSPCGVSAHIHAASPGAALSRCDDRSRRPVRLWQHHLAMRCDLFRRSSTGIRTVPRRNAQSMENVGLRQGSDGARQTASDEKDIYRMAYGHGFTTKRQKP